MGFKVEKLIAFLLVFCLPCVAGAEEVFDKDGELIATVPVGSYMKTDTDRFLTERLMPRLKEAEKLVVNSDAIREYLRILVEIEMERLKNEK